MKKTIEKINETLKSFFEKINKIDKPLARLIKKKGRGLKSLKLEIQNVTTDGNKKDHKQLLQTTIFLQNTQWTNSQKSTTFKTEPGRNGRYEQTNHKY